ncbi:MAG: DUF2878 domain-containing protein [Gammaproteobacteria bacterium]|nr:DUF2878 domain-containing protein [Gammaproteobacteria bacterium]
MKHNARIVVAFVHFQLIWWTCVWGAAWGLGGAATVFALALMIHHFYLSENRWVDAQLLVASVGIGLTVDSLLALLGAYQFGENTYNTPIPPVWLLAIWGAFGLTYRYLLGWLRGRYLIAAALGAVFGPFTYVMGAESGAMWVSVEPGHLVLMALAWLLVLPVMDALHRWIVPSAAQPGIHTG